MQLFTIAVYLPNGLILTYQNLKHYSIRDGFVRFKDTKNNKFKLFPIDWCAIETNGEEVRT